MTNKVSGCLLFIMLFIPITAGAQQLLNEMDIVELPEEDAITARPPSTDDAMLLVYTTISALDFDFNWRVRSIKKLREGLWQIILIPGINIITFSAPYYMPSQRTYSIPKGAAKVIKVSTKENPMQIRANMWRKQKWVSTISTISLGIAAGYFKITADYEYDSYLKADSQIQAIQKWNQVIRNDNKYKIALGLSGSALAYAIFCYIQQRHYQEHAVTSNYKFSIENDEVVFTCTVSLR